MALAAQTSDPDSELRLFLTKSLPQCLEECGRFTQSIIKTGHDELTPHLMSKCDNVCAKELAASMSAATAQLTERVQSKLVDKYREFVSAHIWVHRDDPAVLGGIAKASAASFGRVSSELSAERDALHTELSDKQRTLRRLNAETRALRHELNSTLEEVHREHAQAMAEAEGMRKQLREQCSTEFVTEKSEVDFDIEQHGDEELQGQSQQTMAAKDMVRLVEWDGVEISAVLP